jgi:hypothetical protein
MTGSLFGIAGPGTFDEVAIYGSVLSTARMDAHFTAARPWGDGSDPSSAPGDPTPDAGPVDEADADDPPLGAPAASATPDGTDPGTPVDVSRNAIVNYAFTYVGTKRGTYDTTGYNTLYAPAAGTDCQNFVSQALRAGGWPDDAPAGSDPVIGTNVWWEQPPNQNSFSWTVVTYFWRYEQQSGRGSYVKYWSSAQPGDVAFVDWDGAHGHPTHAMLVTATARTSTGALQVYFTYHSKNRKNYPLTTLRHDFPHAHWWLFHLRDQF